VSRWRSHRRAPMLWMAIAATSSIEVVSMWTYQVRRRQFRTHDDQAVAFPALAAVKELIAATTGLVPRLRERLDRPDIEVAFLFGSAARGEEDAGSDVDLFVVGDIDGVLLANLIREVEREARKEIDLVHWSPADFARRMAEPSSFLPAVMRQPKAFTKGSEDDLRRLAG